MLEGVLPNPKLGKGGATKANSHNLCSGVSLVDSRDNEHTVE